MDEFFKRLGIAYLFFTLSLWLISFGMNANGSATPRNWAWVIVSDLRFLFTAPLVAVSAMAVCLFLFWAWLEVREQWRQAAEKHRWAEEERRQIEERRLRAEQHTRLEAERAAERQVRQQEEAAEAKRREEERQKQKIIEWQTRSARTATERALDDF